MNKSDVNKAYKQLVEILGEETGIYGIMNLESCAMTDFWFDTMEADSEENISDFESNVYCCTDKEYTLCKIEGKYFTTNLPFVWTADDWSDCFGKNAYALADSKGCLLERYSFSNQLKTGIYYFIKNVSFDERIKNENVQKLLTSCALMNIINKIDNIVSETRGIFIYPENIDFFKDVGFNSSSKDEKAMYLSNKRFKIFNKDRK